MKNTQFNSLPKGTYFTSSNKYTGLTKLENFEQNNLQKLSEIARFKKLK
jgi:hypothetical protein